MRIELELVNYSKLKEGDVIMGQVNQRITPVKVIDIEVFHRDINEESPMLQINTSENIIFVNSNDICFLVV